MQRYHLVRGVSTINQYIYKKKRISRWLMNVQRNPMMRVFEAKYLGNSRCVWFSLEEIPR